MSRKNEERKKRIISVILVGCLAIGGTFTYVRQGQVKKQEEIIARNKSILSTQVKRSSIKSTIVGTGSLEAGDTRNIQVPAGIVVDEVLVESGDNVEEGQVLATLNKKSLEDALRKIESSLESIDDELSDLDNDSDERILTAPVSGRVKTIYAYGADKVKDVISDHGSLMTISTDGKLAVDIPTNGNLATSSQVLVELPGGDRIYGTVDSIQGQTTTITIPDNRERVSSNVSVLDNNSGSVLAEGKLYVHSPMNITASSGTISNVYVSENTYVEQGDDLFRLTAAGNDLTRQQLLSDREELLQTMNKLKEYSLSGSIKAPYSGTIKDINLHDNTTISKAISSDGATSLSSLSSLAGASSLSAFGSMMSLGFTGEEEKRVISLPSHSSLPRAISLSFEEEWYVAEAAEEPEADTQLWEDSAASQALEEDPEGFSDPQAAWEEGAASESQGQVIQESPQSKTYLQGSIYLPVPVPREGEYPSSAPMVSPLLQAHLAQEGLQGAYCITGMEWVNPGPFSLGERCIALITLESDKDHGIVFTPSIGAFTIEAEGGPDSLFLLEDGDQDGYYERMVVGLAYTALPLSSLDSLTEDPSDPAYDPWAQDPAFLSAGEDSFPNDVPAGQAQEEDFTSMDSQSLQEDTPFDAFPEIAGQALEDFEDEALDPVGDEVFNAFSDGAIAASDPSPFSSLFGDITDPRQATELLANADDATLQAFLDMMASMSDEELTDLFGKLGGDNPQMAQYLPLLKGMLKNGTLTPTMLRAPMKNILGSLPTPTATIAPTATPQPTPGVTAALTPTSTPEASGTPSVTPTGSPDATPTSSPDATPTGEPAQTPTPAASASPAPTVSITPTVTPAAPGRETYIQLLKLLLGGKDIDYDALLKILMSGQGTQGGSFISAILSSLFQGSGNTQGLMSLLSSIFGSGSEFASSFSSSFDLSSFLKKLMSSGSSSALSGLSSLLGGGTSGLSSLLGGGTSGLSSLLGGSGASGLSSLLGGSGASGLSSLLGGSGASGLSSLLGGSGTGNYASLLNSLGGADSLSSLTSALSSDSLGALSSLGGLSQNTTASTYQDVTGFTIADAQLMNLVININELDVLSVAVGQLVELTLDSLPGESFPGIVTKIAKKGTNSGGLSKYPVTISLLKDERMLNGMNASASITTQESPNVLVIPADSIHETYGKTYVYTSKTDEGFLEGETQVLTGISDGDYVEVTQGLAEGQNIYYNFTLGTRDIPYEQMSNYMQEEMNSMQNKDTE